MGNNIDVTGERQGSEYLFTSHMSQNTYQNIVSPQPPEVNSDQNDGEDYPTRDISIPNSDGVEQVTFVETNNFLTNDSKELQRILVCWTPSTFASAADSLYNPGSGISWHYLIGTNPAISDSDSNQGFIQAIDLDNDAYFGQNATVNSTINAPAKIDVNSLKSNVSLNVSDFATNAITGSSASLDNNFTPLTQMGTGNDAPNINAVSIAFVNGGTGQLTDFQAEQLKNIVYNARQYFGNPSAPIILPQQLTISSPKQLEPLNLPNGVS